MRRTVVAEYTMSFAVVLVAGCSEAPTSPPATDISRWEVKADATNQFAVSIPPGWSTLDFGNSFDGLSFILRLSQEVKVQCTSSTYQVPNLASMTPDQVSYYIHEKGPPSLQRLSSAENVSHPGYQITYISEKTSDVNDYPAYIYELRSEPTFAKDRIFSHEMAETIYSVGKGFGLTCSAHSKSKEETEKIFESERPTMVAILGSFVVLPSEKGK